MAILQNLQEEDVEWRAAWMIPNEILYRCGDFDWVPFLEIWGAVVYALFLVLRQYRSRQFIPVTQRLAQCEFSYKGDNYKKKVCEISNACNQTRRMKILAVNLLTTPEYSWCSELGRKIKQLEEEKMHLGLDVDIHKLEAEKLRKGKKKAEEIWTNYLREVMNSGKSSSIVLKARLEKETTLWAKLWLKYEK
ncbi:hypothetical protein Godav_015165 [Gossypium davidsonii]|uniref:DUF7745 domain-containing protein n=1 Tax=Gossypium davidsonii TaxID=34287 RepID=A0A7J8RM91_GOSDV|nr:hypothetical protein [Gossypium davidsonii]